MIELKVDGIEHLKKVANRMRVMLSPAQMTLRVIRIAREAGMALEAASVRACMELVYDAPEMTYIRTMALLQAHRRTEEDFGLVQIVDIDPQAEAIGSGSPRANREFVSDYAHYVHNGYTQWVFGYDTGEFVPGRFWFDETVRLAYPTIIAFVRAAFTEVVTVVMSEIAA